MSEQRNGERIWDIIERVGVCMLTTQAGGRLRARPLEARPDRKAGLIFAVTVGLIGTLLPAIRAARLPVIAALKSL